MKNHPYLLARYYRALFHGAIFPDYDREPTPGMKNFQGFRRLLTAFETSKNLKPFGGSRRGLSVHAHAMTMKEYWKRRYRLPIIIGQTIRERRGQIPIRVAAARCGMNPSAWGRIENGKGNPTADTLYRMADALGGELSVLIFEIKGK